MKDIYGDEVDVWHDFGMTEHIFDKLLLLGFDDPYNDHGSRQTAIRAQEELDRMKDLSQKERDRNHWLTPPEKKPLWERFKDWWKKVWKR